VAPTLFIHGADDTICPPGQSAVAFRELQRRGVATQRVLYPGSGHGINAGNAAHCRDRNERVLKWFKAHMG